MSKKFLIFAMMIFMLALGSVSAQDIGDDALVGVENQDINDLSVNIIDDADILQETSNARFSVNNSTSHWEVSVLDDDDNLVTEGNIILSFENSSLSSSFEIHDYKPVFDFPIYRYYEILPDTMILAYDGQNHTADSIKISIDALTDSITARDVVDEYSFSAVLCDAQGNPLNEVEVPFVISGKNGYYDELYHLTDSNGSVTINPSLPVDNYTVYVTNIVTEQFKHYSWNITKEDDSRKAFINVSRDNYKFTINAVDADGNNISNGSIHVDCIDDYYDEDVEISNGTAVFVYGNEFYASEGEKSIVFTLINDDYDPVNASCNFTFRDTVTADDSRGNEFNATFTDIDGNPLDSQDVLFTIYDYATGDLIDNITLQTDAMGFASMEREGYYDYEVVTTNTVTYQYVKNRWNSKKEIEMTPVAVYDNETGYYISYNETLRFKVTPDATGNVTIEYRGGYIFNENISEGEFSMTLVDDMNYFLVVYNGDANYSDSCASYHVILNRTSDIVISAPDVTKYYGGPERFVVNVTDNNGTPLANKTVEIFINNKNYTRLTDENGTASIALGLGSNTYNATVIVDYQIATSVVVILPTVNGTDITKVFRNATQYYATFKDSQGNYLPNGTDVRFNINGVMYDRKVSGDEGLARLNINLVQGEYIITAINNVTGEMTSNNITVLAKITENRDIVKYFRNATQYTVKVIGDDGNPVGANETVIFNINGVFYERQTNESGFAKLNINLQPGDYVITAIYDGCMVSNNITVLSILSASDLTKNYGDSQPFVATLVDGQGKAYANQKIQFNINGVFYYRTTNSSGQAQLNINLIFGEYVITSSYNGTSIANNVTILS